MKKGILFVVSGPSGAGKGTVMGEVFKRIDDLNFSVSATTRAPRNGERDGVNYRFVTNEEFDRMIAEGEMLEFIEKFTNRYGTPKFAVESLLNQGKDVLLEIETTGASNVKRLMPECVSIFIAPPSLSALWDRLSGRMTESEEERQLRFNVSKEEIECARHYDYIVINDEVSLCAERIIGIIEAERSKVFRNEDIINQILNN